VQKALASMAVVGLALSVVQAASAATFAPMNVADLSALLPVNHQPQCDGKNSFFPLQQAYRLQEEDVDTTAPFSSATGSCLTARNVGYCGVNMGSGNVVGQETAPHYPPVTDVSCPDLPVSASSTSPELVTVVPGIFALCSVNKSALTPNATTTDFRQRLNVNAFATCPAGYSTPFVQNVRLEKRIPFQPKCPGVFSGNGMGGDLVFDQFGGNIRTWWALMYSPPGTRFILRLTVACQGIPSAGNGGKINIHIDEFEWRVVVTSDSLLAVIDLLHSNAISTSEIPCIAAEDVYLALREAVSRIACADPGVDQQDRLFEAEALVIAFCAFGDCFIAEDFFGTFPPSNDIDMGGAFGPTGILDTIENPCCCKLLVDLDNLGHALNITTPGP